MAEKRSVDRRDFLKSAAATGAAALAPVANAAPAARAPASPRQATAPAPPREADPPAGVEVLTTDRPGGDFMVDVLKSLDFEYVAANPGSSFRGIHESIVNYGGNAAPEFITCCHEESSVAMAHGYFKAEGKPMAVLCHGTVGMQHAAMGIYNAYCDRVPVYLMAGNTLDATLRRPGVEWAHSVQDAAAMVRDFIKWDDLPFSLPHFAESAVRAYKIAMTPPMMPVLLVLDGGLQEDPIAPEIGARLRVPKLTRASAPQGESGAVAEAARLLVAAQNPVIVADRAARTPGGLARLVELAEALQAPVVNQGGRMNFPSRHPLNQSANARQLVASADVIIGLELTDFWGTVNAARDSLVRTSRPITQPGTKLISITAVDLAAKGNYQDCQATRKWTSPWRRTPKPRCPRSPRRASASSPPIDVARWPNAAGASPRRMPVPWGARARKRRTAGTPARSAPLA
jgi:thiamine pyrophosphate-dependent acetolactate synthase large subunit-like protein